MKASIARGSLSLLCLLAVASGASAQAPPPDFLPQGPGTAQLQYNFAPPGARSLAMGAAFIGLADDATAAGSNPAGLTILTKPEISAHFRYSRFENEVPDTVLGTGFGTFPDTVGSPSFFSLVVPAHGAALALSYQRLADYRSHSSFDGIIGSFANLPTLADTDSVETRLRVESYGVSAAFKVGSHASVGGTARVTHLSLDSTQQILLSGGIPLLDQFNQVNTASFYLRDRSIVQSGASKLTWNVGALLTPVSQVSIGAVYRKGATYDLPGSGVNQFAIQGADFQDFDPPEHFTLSSSVRVPDSYGAGVALRASENWTILGDVVRVRYSQTNSYDAQGNLILNLYQLYGEGHGEPLADATEIHVGTEYTWAVGNDWIVAGRVGYYSDPDHDGLAGLDSKQNHFTVGGGVVVKNQLQVDVAANFASHAKEGLLSVVVRF